MERKEKKNIKETENKRTYGEERKRGKLLANI